MAFSLSMGKDKGEQGFMDKQVFAPAFRTRVEDVNIDSADNTGVIAFTLRAGRRCFNGNCRMDSTFALAVEV
jgi:hypothetical protein